MRTWTKWAALFVVLLLIPCMALAESWQTAPAQLLHTTEDDWWFAVSPNGKYLLGVDQYGGTEGAEDTLLLYNTQTKTRSVIRWQIDDGSEAYETLEYMLKSPRMPEELTVVWSADERYFTFVNYDAAAQISGRVINALYIGDTEACKVSAPVAWESRNTRSGYGAIPNAAFSLDGGVLYFTLHNRDVASADCVVMRYDLHTNELTEYLPAVQQENRNFPLIGRSLTAVSENVFILTGDKQWSAVIARRNGSDWTYERVLGEDDEAQVGVRKVEYSAETGMGIMFGQRKISFTETAPVLYVFKMDEQGNLLDLREMQAENLVYNAALSPDGSHALLTMRNNDSARSYLLMLNLEDLSQEEVDAPALANDEIEQMYFDTGFSRWNHGFYWGGVYILSGASEHPLMALAHSSAADVCSNSSGQTVEAALAAEDSAPAVGEPVGTYRATVMIFTDDEKTIERGKNELVLVVNEDGTVRMVGFVDESYEESHGTWWLDDSVLVFDFDGFVFRVEDHKNFTQIALSNEYVYYFLERKDGTEIPSPDWEEETVQQPETAMSNLVVGDYRLTYLSAYGEEYELSPGYTEAVLTLNADGTLLVYGYEMGSRGQIGGTWQLDGSVLVITIDGDTEYRVADHENFTVIVLDNDDIRRVFERGTGETAPVVQPEAEEETPVVQPEAEEETPVVQPEAEEEPEAQPAEVPAGLLGQYQLTKGGYDNNFVYITAENYEYAGYDFTFRENGEVVVHIMASDVSQVGRWEIDDGEIIITVDGSQLKLQNENGDYSVLVCRYEGAISVFERTDCLPADWPASVTVPESQPEAEPAPAEQPEAETQPAASPVGVYPMESMTVGEEVYYWQQGYMDITMEIKADGTLYMGGHLSGGYEELWGTWWLDDNVLVINTYDESNVDYEFRVSDHQGFTQIILDTGYMRYVLKRNDAATVPQPGGKEAPVEQPAAEEESVEQPAAEEEPVEQPAADPTAAPTATATPQPTAEPVTAPIPGYEDVPVEQVLAKSTKASHKLANADYNGTKTIDGNEETCWQFSTKSGKLGKVTLDITLKAPGTVDEMWIKNGFWKITKGLDQYTRNSRPKKIGISFRYQGKADFEDEMEVTLVDDKERKDWQKVTLGRHENVEAVRIRIISIYKGTKFPTDVAVSEIMFVRNDAAPAAAEYKPLKHGDSGKDVLAMKLRLQELGYFTAGSEISDKYNDTCVQRVKQFQKMNGLEQTGRADEITLSILFSEQAKPKK